jgi:hypothetical protein
MEWSDFDLDGLAEHLRTNTSPADAETMVWAFEEVLRVARIDNQLLPSLLAATVCLLARVEDSSPRAVLEAFFRRSVSDEVWRECYRPLFR